MKKQNFYALLWSLPYLYYADSGNPAATVLRFTSRAARNQAVQKSGERHPIEAVKRRDVRRMVESEFADWMESERVPGAVELYSH